MKRALLFGFAAWIIPCSLALQTPSSHCPKGRAGVGLQHARRYSGPVALGPFRIDRNEPVREVWEKMGKPPLPKTDYVCYRDREASGTYLYLVRGADNARILRGVMLSVFPNCLKGIVNQADGFYRWRTERGIGLGSTEDAVVAAYGNPSSVDNAKREPKAYVWEIYGSDGSMGVKYRWPHGDRVLNYASPKDVNDLSAASFGIKDGKVTWIWISDNE